MTFMTDAFFLVLWCFADCCNFAAIKRKHLLNKKSPNSTKNELQAAFYDRMHMCLLIAKTTQFSLIYVNLFLCSILSANRSPCDFTLTPFA